MAVQTKFCKRGTHPPENAIGKGPVCNLAVSTEA